LFGEKAAPPQWEFWNRTFYDKIKYLAYKKIVTEPTQRALSRDFAEAWQLTELERENLVGLRTNSPVVRREIVELAYAKIE
jgi:hypothetical protein